MTFAIELITRSKLNETETMADGNEKCRMADGIQYKLITKRFLVWE